MTNVNRLFSLEGKVAIVTGGNGGLGLGMAEGLAGAGANIVVAARDAEKTKAAVSQIEAIGVQALGVRVDVTQESDINEMVSQTMDAFGRVDILVNNAGVTMRKEPQDLSADEWDHVLDVNLRAAFWHPGQCTLA
jgi:2-deoxy-D-gluconate 3-dehydrogenase